MAALAMAKAVGPHGPSRAPLGDRVVELTVPISRPSLVTLFQTIWTFSRVVAERQAGQTSNT